jgi:hypothetical protein
MLFGKTKVKYTRTVQPEEYEITSVKGDKNVDNIPLSKKLKRYIWNTIR